MKHIEELQKLLEAIVEDSCKRLDDTQNLTTLGQRVKESKALAQKIHELKLDSNIIEIDKVGDVAHIEIPDIRMNIRPFTDVCEYTEMFDYLKYIKVVEGKKKGDLFEVGRFKPKLDEKYWVLDDSVVNGFEEYINLNDIHDKLSFNRIPLYRTEEEAKEAVKAMGWTDEG